MKTRIPILCGALLVFLFLFSSCNQAPERNPIIQEKFQKLADLAEEVDQLKGKIKDIQLDIDTITQDLMTLKQMPKSEGASPTEIEGMKSRIKQLEGEVSKLESELSKWTKKAAALKETRQTKTPSKSTREQREETEPTPKKRGKYYQVKSGDTLEDIARKFNTTPASIREENRLPAGKEPIPGTRLYVIPGD